MGALKTKPPTRRDAADAARLQKAGQHGDTVLAHINPDEARLLDYLADRKIDAPRNPRTGLLSFGMSDAEGPSGHDSNPGGVGGGPAGGNTGGGIGGNTEGGQGGLSGGYGPADSYAGSVNQRRAEELGNYYRDTYVNGMLDDPYAEKGTWTRLMQELFRAPSGPAAPGRLGMPNAIGPGIVGTAANMMSGGLLGGVMSLGGAMGRAGGVTTGPDSRNSGGNPSSSSLSDRDSLGSQTAGSSSGAETAGLLNASRSPTMQTLPGAAPGVVPGTAPADPSDQASLDRSLSLSDRSTWSGLPPVVQSILMDYIWRGRSGSGW